MSPKPVNMSAIIGGSALAAFCGLAALAALGAGLENFYSNGVLAGPTTGVLLLLAASLPATASIASFKAVREYRRTAQSEKLVAVGQVSLALSAVLGAGVAWLLIMSGEVISGFRLLIPFGIVALCGWLCLQARKKP
jgi:hypothetical protein